MRHTRCGALGPLKQYQCNLWVSVLCYGFPRHRNVTFLPTTLATSCVAYLVILSHSGIPIHVKTLHCVPVCAFYGCMHTHVHV